MYEAEQQQQQHIPRETISKMTDVIDVIMFVI